VCLDLFHPQRRLQLAQNVAFTWSSSRSRARRVGGRRAVGARAGRLDHPLSSRSGRASISATARRGAGGGSTPPLDRPGLHDTSNQTIGHLHVPLITAVAIVRIPIYARLVRGSVRFI